MKIKGFSLITILLAGMITFSCNNDETQEDPKPDSTTSKDHSMIKGAFEYVHKQVKETMQDSSSSINNRIASGKRVMDNSCVNIVLKTGNPDSLYFHFKDSVKCNDSRYRTGTIAVEATDRYKNSGAVITTELRGYHFSNKEITANNPGHQLKGTRVVTNEGGGTYNIGVTNGKLLMDNGDIILWESNHTRKWVNGSNTAKISDDQYKITGEFNGTNRNGRDFTATIQEALTVKGTCLQQWILHPVNGVLDINPNNMATRSIDYGDGSCNRKARLSVKDFTIKIHLQ